MAMDVDEDEDGTQRPKQVSDYGIQVDFESIDEDNLEDPSEAAARFDKEIADKTAEIERMAPNLKAIDRSVLFWSLLLSGWLIDFFFSYRLDDVEMKLADTEKEADKARKDSKVARDHFNDVKMRRFVCHFCCDFLIDVLIAHICRCDLFNKAYNHISDRIDEVYKELTKGKASPMGGVAYLSLEDSEVCYCV